MQALRNLGLSAVRLANPLFRSLGLPGRARQWASGSSHPPLSSRLWAARILNPLGVHDVASVHHRGLEILVDSGDVVGRNIAYGLDYEPFELSLVATAKPTYSSRAYLTVERESRLLSPRVSGLPPGDPR